MSWVHVWQHAHGLDELLLVGLGVGVRSREVQTLVERGGMTLWTSSCDPPAISSAVLFRSSGASVHFRVDGVRDGVLLVLSSVVNRDK